jgi:hypothetical protein
MTTPKPTREELLEAHYAVRVERVPGGWYNGKPDGWFLSDDSWRAVRMILDSHVEMLQPSPAPTIDPDRLAFIRQRSAVLNSRHQDARSDAHEARALLSEVLHFLTSPAPEPSPQAAVTREDVCALDIILQWYRTLRPRGKESLSLENLHTLSKNLTVATAMATEDEIAKVLAASMPLRRSYAETARALLSQFVVLRKPQGGV